MVKKDKKKARKSKMTLDPFKNLEQGILNLRQ